MLRLILMYFTFGLTIAHNAWVRFAMFANIWRKMSLAIVSNEIQVPPHLTIGLFPLQLRIDFQSQRYVCWVAALTKVPSTPHSLPSTLSPPHPTCLLSQPPAPLLVPVSTLVRLLHTTSLHIAQLPIQHWIQRILEEHIHKLHSWQQQPPPHPWQFENMFVWCLERDSNSSSQGARGKPLFRCASISWFQAVSGSVGNLPFSASASTSLSELFVLVRYRNEISKKANQRLS